MVYTRAIKVFKQHFLAVLVNRFNGFNSQTHTLDRNVLKVFDGVLQLLNFNQSQYVFFIIFGLLFHLMRDFLILKLRDDFQIFIAHLISSICLCHQIAFAKGNTPLKFMILNNLFGRLLFFLAVLFFFFHFEMHSVMLVLHLHQV